MRRCGQMDAQGQAATLRVTSPQPWKVVSPAALMSRNKAGSSVSFRQCSCALWRVVKEMRPGA